ncbi:hypothetical protein [Fusicatenibacter saccharivorans]|jgi:hypothetical protein|uniref:hypothetical protein n=1 Tax=Fusicatenibacter saccharivorans TaxID=1150298 RepID=UPI0032BF49C8
MESRSDEIILKSVCVEKEKDWWKVRYDYQAPDRFKKYIKGENYLFVEFPASDKEFIPEGILTVPFVGIMLTAAMLMGIKIKVRELDETFAKSLKNIEDAFQRMYHTEKIKIEVSSRKTTPCNYTAGEKNSLFFTGGVDATSALVSTFSKKPLLINIWGGDLRLTDQDSHAELEQYLKRLTQAMGLEFCFVKTNAREMFDENALGELCFKTLGRKYNHDWWSSIAHILSMLTTAAPLMYSRKIKEHYIGSSYEVTSDTFDSNNEQLVNVIKYSSGSFHIVDKELDRNEKVKRIIQYEKAISDTGDKVPPIELKVCWNRQAGKNCCSCEKCYRTIMNIIVNHGNPVDLGFPVDRKVFENMKEYLSTKKVNKAFWIPIQKEFLKEEAYWRRNEDVSWILDVKINSSYVYLRRLKEIIRRR